MTACPWEQPPSHRLATIVPSVLRSTYRRLKFWSDSGMVGKPQLVLILRFSFPFAAAGRVQVHLCAAAGPSLLASPVAPGGSKYFQWSP